VSDTGPVTSDEFLDRFIEGDPLAWEIVFKAHYVEFCAQVRRQYHLTTSLAEDAVMEAFLKAWKCRDHLNRRQRPFRLQAWLAVICHNCALNTVRAYRDKIGWTSATDLPERDRTGGGKDPDDIVLQMPSRNLIPDDRVELRSLIRSIEDAIGKLTRRQRHVFDLTFVDGLTHERIAFLLGITPKGVEARMARLHQTLRPFKEQWLEWLEG
jgi:RNA polymerase sigma factor (sigma-70 family)